MLPIVGTLISTGMTLIDKFYTTDEEKAEAKFKLIQLEQEGKTKELEAELAKLQVLGGIDIAQAEVNKVEAAHSSLFVSGWRPMAGWIAVASLGMAMLGRPLINFGVSTYNAVAFDAQMSYMNALNVEDAVIILMSMLGMSAVRSVEKVMGVARQSK